MPQLLPTDNFNLLRGIQIRWNLKITIFGCCSRQWTLLLIDFCTYTYSCTIFASLMSPYCPHMLELSIIQPLSFWNTLYYFPHLLPFIHFLHLECYSSQSFCTKLSHCTFHNIGQTVHSRQMAVTQMHVINAASLLPSTRSDRHTTNTCPVNESMDLVG